MISDYAKQESCQLEAMKGQIQACIDALPDNERISRSSHNVFTARSSELRKHDNWSPEFHDFKLQYRLILSRLDTVKSIAEFQTFLRNAIADKHIKKDRTRYKLHPSVIAALEELL